MRNYLSDLEDRKFTPNKEVSITNGRLRDAYASRNNYGSNRSSIQNDVGMVNEPVISN